MQANGAGQAPESELSCLNNGAQNGDGGGAHSNGLSTVNNGTPVSNNGQVGSNSVASDANSTAKKNKCPSQSEEDVIRLIGQHLHDLGLK